MKKVENDFNLYLVLIEFARPKKSRVKKQKGEACTIVIPLEGYIYDDDDESLDNKRKRKNKKKRKMYRQFREKERVRESPHGVW